MLEVRYPNLGETWLAILREVYRSGRTVGDETRELLLVCAEFEKGDFDGDPLLARFASRQHVEQMRKVFFSSEPNAFGHSYADRLYGPQGRNDLSDVIDLLTRQPWSKRAVVSLVGAGDGRVPCINAIQFLRREGTSVAFGSAKERDFRGAKGDNAAVVDSPVLKVVYFARGQDIFRKFYADGVCIYEMAQRVAAGLGIPLAGVSGVIGSAHVYLDDLPEIQELLGAAEAFQLPRPAPHVRPA
jgi:thymidylate synthase